MRVRTKRKIRKVLRTYQKIYALILILVFAVIVIVNGNSVGNSLNQTEQVASPKNETLVSGETIFTKICMKCHTTPEKYKSFTLYFGKPESIWEVGVKKMVTAGNVKLSKDQIKLVAKYLNETYRGG